MWVDKGNRRGVTGSQKRGGGAGLTGVMDVDNGGVGLKVPDGDGTFSWCHMCPLTEKKWKD